MDTIIKGSFRILHAYILQVPDAFSSSACKLCVSDVIIMIKFQPLLHGHKIMLFLACHCFCFLKGSLANIL